MLVRNACICDSPSHGGIDTHVTGAGSKGVITWEPGGPGHGLAGILARSSSGPGPLDIVLPIQACEHRKREVKLGLIIRFNSLMLKSIIMKGKDFMNGSVSIIHLLLPWKYLKSKVGDP